VCVCVCVCVCEKKSLDASIFLINHSFSHTKMQLLYANMLILPIFLTICNGKLSVILYGKSL